MNVHMVVLSDLFDVRRRQTFGCYLSPNQAKEVAEKQTSGKGWVKVSDSEWENYHSDKRLVIDTIRVI